jgi:hypothetical protein
MEDWMELEASAKRRRTPVGYQESEKGSNRKGWPPRAPALQDILEKSARELGAIRLIDSRIGVPGQLARNPRVILGRFRTTIRFASLQLRVLLVNLRLHSIHSDIHRTSGSLGHRFCWTRNTDAAGLAGVASDRHHRWLGILDFASRTGHRAVVG